MPLRAGLLILRGGFFVGWQSRGMRDASAFARISIPASDHVIERLGKERQPLKLQASEMGEAFASAAPAGPGDIYLIPLLIRDRLAGIVYADGGLSDAVVQVEVVQAMSLIACIAVETASLRKPAGSGAMQPAPSASRPEPVRPSPAASAKPEAPAAVIPVADPVVAPQPTAAPVVTPPAPPVAMASPGSSPSYDIHAKAKRFAKLLVEEIQLYNQVKVTEGRSKRDLYERLRPDIEKSRAAYQKRYGGVIRDVDYFSEELVRILAGNDRTLLGSSFPG